MLTRHLYHSSGFVETGGKDCNEFIDTEGYNGDLKL